MHHGAPALALTQDVTVTARAVLRAIGALRPRFAPLRDDVPEQVFRQIDDYTGRLSPADRPRDAGALAGELAAFAARQTRLADIRSAISQWKEDLQYLKTTYYDGKYNSVFPWPDNSVIALQDSCL